MRVIAGIVSVISVAVVVGSAALVIAREDSPRLAVRVEGVPGYVYYQKAYPLTVHFANDGRALAGPVELSVQLPETFALTEHIDEPSRHGERLVWQLDGLDAGESGSVQITVQGTLPDDLTNAVYDLPGYVGHTAFVEGFQLAVELNAVDASAHTLAVADTGEPAGSGEITIIKSAGPGADVDFTFSITAPGNQPCEDNSFTLNDGSPATDDISFTGCAIDIEYTVGETDIPDGWDFDSIACAINSGSATFQESGASVTITLLENGSQVTCGFTNVPEDETGTIIITKDVDPEPDGTDFSFADDIPGCTVGTLDDDGAGATPNSVTCNDVEPGDYQVTEGASTYTLTDIACNDANSEGNVASRTAFIDLSAGETVECVFNNVPPAGGTIVIEKDVDPEPDPRDFVFTDNIPGCDISVLDDDPASGTPSTVSCSDVPPGNYLVTEADPSPYSLFSLVCDDPDDGSTVSSRTAHINLDDGETVHCVFKNRPPQEKGSITIIKRTEPAGANTLFNFSMTGYGAFALGHNDSKTFTDLSSGNYTVSEVVPSGWSVSLIDCGAAGKFTNTNAIVIGLDDDEDVTCIFVNKSLAAPTPTKPAPTPTKPPATVGPVVVAPPSAGDGGLADTGLPWFLGVTSVVAASTVVWIFFQRLLGRTRR